MIRAVACVGPVCSDVVPATSGELLGVALVVVVLVTLTGAAFAVLGRYVR